MNAPIVATSSGKISGRSDGHVCEFLGVPYGAPTWGTNRFRPPQPVVPWQGVRAATTFGPYSPQTRQNNSHAQRADVKRIVQPDPRIPQSEDCLNLNVWTPTLDRNARLPVMVWLHGGAWVFGVPGGPYEPATITNGDRLAATGEVVVVTVTHRLGVLGFCSIEHLLGDKYAGSGNAGILDLVAALEWVRDNIAAFGGDAGNVTIFGHSGGAAKVAALMALPRAQGLFHRAGCLSGHISLCYTLNEGRAMAEEMLGELGLTKTRAAKVSGVPVERVIDAHAAMIRNVGGFMGGGLNALRFGPVVDGVVYPTHPLEAIAAGVAAGVPLLASTTREEFNIELVGDPRFNLFTETDLFARARVFLGERSEQVVRAYQAARPGASSTENLSQVVGDNLIVLPMLDIVERHRLRSRVPSYMMMVTYQSRGMGGLLGAYHGVELPFIFDTTEREPKLGVVERDRPLVEATRNAWLNFARTGNPNHAGLPQWPAYDPDTRATMLFNGECCIEHDPLRFARKNNFPLPPRPAI